MFGCRSLDSPPIRRLPLDPFSSTFYLFNGVSKRNKESNLWILHPYKARYIPFLKPKQQLKTHKCVGNRKAAQKTKIFQSAEDGRTARGEHHEPTVVSSGYRGFDASWTLRFELLLDLGICLGSSCFGPIGLAFQLSSFGPNHANLQS